MSDYIVTKAYEKYTQNKHKCKFEEKFIEQKCRCERCKTELLATNLNEFFMKLYCNECLKIKIKFRIKAKMASLHLHKK